MCELKARRENGDSNGKSGSTESPSEEALFLQQQRNQLVDRYIRESKLLGLSLKHHDQLSIHNLINDKLIQEQQNFVSTANQATSIFQSNIISPQFLDCLPDHVITQINHHDANSVFNSFMRYCPDQNLRKDFWLSYYSRAAPYLGSTMNNFLSIEKIRDSRYRKARLLGYDNFAQMANDLRGAGGPTMAGSVENVRAFINGLGMRTDTRFEKNIKELTEFATSGAQRQSLSKQPANANNLVEKLNLWDLKYFERLFLREMYHIDSRDVRAHFPLERVVTGMLEFAENLFGIKIVEIKNEKNTWGPNVRHFKVFGNSAKSTAEYGSFYFDPYQRESRILMPISRSEALHTKPIVFFLMNFTAGTGSIFDQYDSQMLATGKELLNFGQVIDLFGKFGYVLQHLLTEVNFVEIGSLLNLEADSFNTVSHFMRMWPLNSYEVLAKCSSHIKTGEPMSQEFFERIRKSYYHFVSLTLKRELYLMALDLNLHTLRDHASSVQKQTWKEWMTPFEPLEEDGHICSALDIFSGNGMEGIYYSDKWSEVIAADVFDAFRDSRSGSMKSPEQIRALGLRFKETFFAQSGAVETNELFRRFIGRDPTLHGYLSINGFE
ncbi:hypothetical protein TYRP_004262 [Tyrophagus putrescentiae]|nr:hypothetical protein TYRP_004262 [Tyrophagus putrescentiae]